MTLATRCPACGTVFRVVQDQLRVSEGWVRCGRCTEVFNAADRLVEMPTGATTRRTAEQDPPRTEDDRLSADSRPVGIAPTPDTAGRAENALPSSSRDADENLPWPEPDSVAPHEETEPEVHRALARTSPDFPPVASTGPEANRAATRLEPAARAEPVMGDANAPAPATPSFVRQAERAQRWRRPGVRVALALAALVAASGLGAQALLEYRDIAAARWSGLRPALERACGAIGCQVEAPRLIEGLVVDSSGLVRTEGTPLYRLSVVLRNRATLALAPPSIDLSLTDARGRVVSRKVLSLADLGVTATALSPGGTTPLQAVLQIAEGPVTGYTIELFYP